MYFPALFARSAMQMRKPSVRIIYLLLITVVVISACKSFKDIKHSSRKHWSSKSKRVLLLYSRNQTCHEQQDFKPLIMKNLFCCLRYWKICVSKMPVRTYSTAYKNCIVFMCVIFMYSFNHNFQPKDTLRNTSAQISSKYNLSCTF